MSLIRKMVFESFHSKFGIEREAQRIDKEGNLSLKSHPKKLGSPLTHPRIKTDFCESQVEFATNVHPTIGSALRELDTLHRYTVQNLDIENLWPFSMPPRLPSDEKLIPIANYGESQDAIKKRTYRLGLSHRYGRRMQAVSGVHFNFSFSEHILRSYSKIHYNTDLSQNIKSDLYLHVIRNFSRNVGLLHYLFGSTSVVDQSFLPDTKFSMDSLSPETLFSSHATSLRMSDIGYTSKVQEKIFLSLNSIEEYCDNLCEMVSTKYPDYTKYNPEQLNDHILQIENEYYAPIRPKNKIDSNLRPVDAIRENGIEYIEVRSLDISPYHPNGIDKKSLYFISLFLHYCLDSDSPPICRDEYFSLFKSWQKIAWQGRDPLLEIELLGGKVSFFNYMETIFKGMFEFVERRLSGRIKIFYSNILKEEYEKLKNPSLLPSSKMENEIKKSGQSFLNWGLERSQMNKNQWLSKSIPLDSLRFLEKEANSSWELAQSFSMNPDSEVKHTKAVKNPCMSSN